MRFQPLVAAARAPERFGNQNWGELVSWRAAMGDFDKYQDPPPNECLSRGVEGQ